MPARANTTDAIELTEAAMAVALSLVLGAVRIVELPNGGSIAFGTAPLLAFALVRGPRLGVLAATCAGLAHALLGGTVIHPAQFLLDYGLSYAALGLAGFASVRSLLQIRLGILVAGALQLACCTVSGMIFFAPVGGDHIFEASLIYNAATIVPESILACVLVPTLVRAIARANPAEGWRLGLLAPPRQVARSRRCIHPHRGWPQVAAASLPTAMSDPVGAPFRPPIRSTFEARPVFVSRPLFPPRRAQPFSRRAGFADAPARTVR